MANAGVRLRSKEQQNRSSKSDRPIDEDDKKSQLERRQPGALGLGHLISIAALVYLILAFVSYNYYYIPRAKRANEDDVGTYSEGRARKHLEKLVAIGPRLAGTYNNEVVAFNYIMNELKMIQMSAKPHSEIEIDVQRPSGSFFLQFLGGFTHSYANITNIVARISPRRSHSKDNALLVNCHFDTVVDSPGASDDAVSCATMLELLRALAHADESRWPMLQHSVVFLFNGAEESVLPASHGFITQHKWKDTLRAFINLDAAGAGGRELVFQTGPENPWLIRNYMKHAPHPFASVVGQEIFETAIVPADTDFRIFRDYGKIPGLDLAYVTNGYVYHTRYDDTKAIPPGCMQRTGENVLGAMRGLVCTDELVNPGYSRHGKIVFTDVLGIFTLLYPERLGYILNYSISVIAVAIIIARYLPRLGGIDELNLYHLIFGMGAYLLSWLVGFITAPAIAYIIMSNGRPLSWYTHSVVIFPLYAIPTIFTTAAVHYYAKMKFCQPIISWQLQQAVADANVIIWSFVTIFLSNSGIASAFLSLTWPASFLLIDKFIWNGIFKRNYYHSQTAYLIVLLVSVLIPMTLNTYLIWAVFDFFMPILGRCGSVVPSEIVIAVITGSFTLLLVTSVVNVVYVAKSLKWPAIIFGISFLTCFFLVITGAIFPYSGPPNPHAQRLLYQHIHRKFHDRSGVVTDSDSGIILVPMDANGLRYLSEHDNYFKNATITTCKGANCGYPAFYPVRSLTGHVWYKEGSPPTFPKEIDLKLVKKDVTSSGRKQKFYFSIVDPPSQLRLYIDPANGTEIVAWSFTDGKPKPLWNGDHYTAFVWYTQGHPTQSWDFWIELNVNKGSFPNVQ
ncbi:uncharacterized protein TRIADDRAFT_28009 [Trichoplax adhaerens]|uniref:Uncharacterized protein n=1 Tax=Trichoplax adhaerens TaxID=10228 RepID=B3S2G0_TRIAD|nr:hypothetical protein TRIADDRAFT_28009 [Trichoplax adhaerens]EDV23411.1 hypothetical protein TRIADDRAFT_28009 [Trichoplax adhaerens]|eukprot:XP_002114321.1 hypothetical protein TRIADDRAFT_28009 [Trichoplax adhaerens]